MTAYEKLKNELSVLSNIGKASSILGWDQRVMMPKEAGDERAKMLAVLGVIAHEKFTSPAMGELIDKAANDATSDLDKKNLRMIRQDYALATCLSSDFVFRRNEAISKCQTVWEEAKPNSDWEKVLPDLRECVDLTRQEAALYGKELGCTPYDALLRLYAPGNSQALIDPLFAQLKKDLPPLIKAIVARQPESRVEFTLDVDKQAIIGRALAQAVGFSFDRGRLDISAHPFSGGTSADSRITTRYSAAEPFNSLYGVMHEVGHALYSQNLPKAWEDMPLGSDRDLSLHESQSLIVELQAGFSDGFLKYLYGVILQHEPAFAEQGDVEAFKKSIRRVGPSFIRVEADEATYPLHVILRYEIEKEIFNNGLDVEKIPELWNAKVKEYLGLDVPEYRLGCMQDVHWFSGGFGYFPTYTQGALYAAQLFAALKKAVPDINAQLERGDFRAFMKWLNENVHNWGQIYDAADLIEKATGAKPSAQYFLDHLKARYLG